VRSTFTIVELEIVPRRRHTPREAGSMKDESRLERSSRERTLVALKELIEALDRRVPRVERVGELRIATEAMALRSDAARRIAQLQATDRKHEAELADAVMADDGAPLGTS
jgi:hypothetical protein